MKIVDQRLNNKNVKRNNKETKKYSIENHKKLKLRKNNNL